MYITSAMFEVHCFHISKDILCFVICLPLEPLMTSPVFWKKLEYLSNVRQYSKNENTILFFVLKALQISFIYFLLHRHFKKDDKNVTFKMDSCCTHEHSCGHENP